MLDAAGIAYTINERMVRGLDYYTRTTFEFTHGGLGAQSAVLGGGRYDGLSESLGGPKAPGIGFAIGEDRLILALQSEGETAAEKLQAYVAPLGTGMNVHALMLARELRRAGISADLGDESFRLKKSFELAEKSGAHFIVIVGENEIASNQFAVKDLASGQQVQVPRAELAKHLRRIRVERARAGLQARAKESILKGHGFSRAVIDSRKRALAPEGTRGLAGKPRSLSG